MKNKHVEPALSPQEWVEWRAYKRQLNAKSNDSVRATRNALQTIARNNDLLPDDSPYKITHATVQDLHAAADCLEKEGQTDKADATRNIAAMLHASLEPTETDPRGPFNK